MTFFASTTCCAADATPVIKPFAIITPRTGKSMVDIAPDTAPDTAAVPNPYVRMLHQTSSSHHLMQSFSSLPDHSAGSGDNTYSVQSHNNNHDKALG